MCSVIIETGLRFDRTTGWTRPDQNLHKALSPDKKRDRRSALCCAQCGQRITEHASSMEYAGAHQYIFTNPGGYRYDLALFAAADCIREGPATLEYTWFSGFAWRLALCCKCRMHLGWYYSRTGQAGFYGLIRSRLVDVNQH